MSSTDEEVDITFLFSGSVSSDEQDLAIDEDIAACSLFPNSHFVPDSKVAVRD